MYHTKCSIFQCYKKNIVPNIFGLECKLKCVCEEEKQISMRKGSKRYFTHNKLKEIIICNLFCYPLGSWLKSLK